MSLFDRFEKGVEGLMNGALSRVFQADLRPVDLAQQIHQHLDSQAVALDREQKRTVVPNQITLALAGPELGQIQQWGQAALARELADNTEAYAKEQGYVMLGPAEVEFVESSTVSPGQVVITSTTRAAATAAPTTAVSSAAHPLLEVGGARYLLTGEVTVLGRGSEADVVIDDSGVSRRHLELRRTPAGVVLTDLGSTNGTFVEGNRTQAATLLNGNRITIGRTQIMFWAAQDEDPANPANPASPAPLRSPGD